MTRDWRRLPWRLRYVRGAMLASDLRRFGIRLTHRHCHVEFQGPVRLGPGFVLNIPDSGTLIVGPGVDFRRGFACEISGDGRVEIGAGTSFTSHAFIQCTTSVTIGVGCMFAQGLNIIDGNHGFRDHTLEVGAQGYDYRPITIGNGVLVLSKVTILANVGERAVIGAHAVVNRDIPPLSLAVGVPARVIEYFGAPEQRRSSTGEGSESRIVGQD